MTSILDPDRHRFDRSAYERPNFKYRCGRAANWGKPCMRGPNPDGGCGGTAACNPVMNKNGRHECRRSAIAGGPCENGPQPDGKCSINQPPCKPRRSMRGIRCRLGLLALGLVMAFIGGFMGLSENSLGGLNWANPGPLVSSHAGFITVDDCKMCHAPHNSGASGWLEAFFTPADVTSQCTNCHSFDGPALLAHNRTNPDRPDMEETSCLMCHTEHKGETASIVEHSDVQCASCHKKKFSSFSNAHPKFSDRFPYDRRTAIKFDHGSHFAKHFTDKRFVERAPGTCLTCHSQEPNQRSLVRAGFENGCGACHDDQIAKRELVLLRLPEFLENTIDRDSVIDACGPIFDEFGALTQPATIEQALIEQKRRVAVATFTSLLAAGGDAGWMSTLQSAGAGVVLAAVSDDALIAELAAGLTSAVDLLIAHEDKIETAFDVIIRDEAGVEREVFRNGDYMVIEIPPASRGRFINIDYFMSDGQVLHMYPNAMASDNFVAAGKSLTLGVPEIGRQAWQVGPPYGDDLLVIVATDKRLHDDERPMVEKTPGYLAFLERQLSESETGAGAAIQYRVVSTAKDEAAAAAIVSRRRQNEARLAEVARLAEEARQAEETRLAEKAQALLAEEERLAEEAQALSIEGGRLAEKAQALLAEEDRLAEKAQALLAEEERLDEVARLAEEAEEEAEEDEDENEDEEEEEFESISTEEKSIIGAYLLDVAADDLDEYSEPMQELILAMVEEGFAPLAEIIDERADRPVSSRLLAGLNPETMKRLACAWAANLEYELPAEPSMGGWYGDYLELRYRPTGHGDTVSMDWINFGLAIAQDAEDDDSGERAVALRDSLISPKNGVGACTKCHSVNAAAADENIITVGWRARDVVKSERNFTFSHSVHLNLLDARNTGVGQADQGCRACHVVDLKADFAAGYGDFDPQSYASNFKAIEKETCTDCHSKGNVREGCQLCHDYHRGPIFQIRISNNEF